MKFAAVSALSLAVMACGAPPADVTAAGERLAQELPAAFPTQIVRVAFENNPPMDPPALFVDLVPSMTADDQLRFLCQEIVPAINRAGASIPATVSYGWWSDSDCSSVSNLK